MGRRDEFLTVDVGVHEIGPGGVELDLVFLDCESELALVVGRNGEDIGEGTHVVYDGAEVEQFGKHDVDLSEEKRGK